MSTNIFLRTSDSVVFNNFHVGEEIDLFYLVIEKQSSSPLDSLIYLTYFHCPGKYLFSANPTLLVI